MGAQFKIILIIAAILAAVGAAGVGLHYGMRGIDETETAGPPDGTDTAAVLPTDDEASESGGDPSAEALPPSFDIVRVEPNGDLVAAGRAASKAHVMLFLGDEELEKAEANSIGEWAMVLAEPLEPGSYDLLLRGTGPDGKGGPVDGDHVTVVIEGDGRTPLVAITRPGQPTEVVQQPEEETVVASAPDTVDVTKDEASRAESEPAPTRPSQDQAAPAEQATSDASAARQPAESQRAVSQSAETEAAPQTAQAPDAGEPTSGQQASAQEDEKSSGDQPQADRQIARTQTPAESEAPQSGGSDTGPGGTVATASSDASPNQEPVASESAGTQTASAQSAPPENTSAEPSGEKPAGKVSIETVEVEDPDWLMLSGEATPGDAVRLYLNNEQLADVETGNNGRWSSTSQRPMPPGRYELRADVVGRDGKVTARAEVRFDRVQIVAADDAQVPSGDAAADQATEQVAASDQISGEPGSTVTIVSHASGSGAATAGPTVGEGAGTSVVVIARGDNLWRIARKIYGRGVRHSVIYEANRNQIRNPHLIYPGQVFTIPVLEGENE